MNHRDDHLHPWQPAELSKDPVQAGSTSSSMQLVDVPFALPIQRLHLPARPFDLWCCFAGSLPPLASIAPEILHLLSPEERQRLHTLRRESDRQLFLATRLLVRSVLSEYAAIPPSEWRFAANAFGRPHLAPEIVARMEQSARRLHFNLSRSGSLAVCAISRSGEIGVDIEEEHSAIDPLEIAPGILSEAELQAFRDTPAHKRVPTPLNYWTLKEAYLKARGIGLTVDVKHIAFLDIGSTGFHAHFSAILADSPVSWQFDLLRVFKRYRIAIAFRPSPTPDA